MIQQWIKHICIFIVVCSLPFTTTGQNNNLSDLSIIIEFKSMPVSVDIVHSPLKYDKKFALSYTLDDGLKDAYTHAFKYLTGGVVDGINYNPIYYTDGCGNNINFTMSAAILSLSNDLAKDTHDPNGDYTERNITWPEIIEMYQGGWGIFNHGLTTSTIGDKDYLIGRNHSYIKLKTQGAISGGINTTVFVPPNGDETFTNPAFKQGYHATYRQWHYGGPYLNVFSPSSIIDLNNLKMARSNLGSTISLANIADDLYAASNSISNNIPWTSTFNHSVNGGVGYTFNTFKQNIQSIANSYGKDGLDNIWFTTEEEVLDYVIIRDAININQQAINNKIYLTFSGNTPTDLRNYALSLVVASSSTDTVISVTINGDTHSSISALNKPNVLINVDWFGSDFPTALELATSYVDSTVQNSTQNVANIAIDYVNMVDPGPAKDELINRLINIPGLVFPADFTSSLEILDFEYSGELVGQEVVFINKSEIDEEVITISWDLLGNGIYNDGWGDTVRFIYSAPGIYSVSLRITIKSLQSFVITKDIEIIHNLDVRFDYSKECVGTATRFTNATISSDAIVNVTWDLNNDGLFNEASGENLSYLFPEAGNYNIGLRVITASGLVRSKYQQVTVANIPVANFSVSNACIGGFAEFTNLTELPSTDNAEFIWKFGDGGAWSFISNPIHTYNSSGIFNVTLVVNSSFGCSNTVIKNVSVNPVPQLSFQFSGDTIITEGESVMVTALGDFDQIIWSNGATTNPIAITQQGSYFAEITKNGCTNSLTFFIDVIDRVGITNLITPNGDGYNDTWKIFHIEKLFPCKVNIYTRSGVEVYSNSNYNNNWGGIYKGVPLPEGTYYYILKCNDGKISQGPITIIR